MLKRFLIILLSSFCILAFAQEASQDGIPAKPRVERLVNDLAQILSSQECQQLEQKLVAYANQTSTQVAVVTVKDLNGYERADFAVRLGQKWGIGSSKNDNGILLLVKPKYADSKGQVHIAVGYGLEGAATDLATGQIVRNLIIPHFKQNDYFGGINIATDALIDLTKGEYNEASYPPEQEDGTGFVWALLIMIIILFVFVGSSKKRASQQYQMNKLGGSVPLWLLFSLLSQGSGRGSFDDFSSGSGGFGSGGFGGFGGGSFGGGGAGGSW